MDCKLKAINRINKIKTILTIMRMFHSIDPHAVNSESINDMHSLLNINKFYFKRSYEEIESFTSSSDPNKFYLAILTNRKLQVYDYIKNKLVFMVKVPNGAAFN